MTSPSTSPPNRNWAVYLVLMLLVAFSAFFMIQLLSASDELPPASIVEAGMYADRVSALLASADPVRGETLLTTYACTGCHRVGRNVAPSFSGIADRAHNQRPPLTTAEYLYESIIHPGAYVVDGYANAMVQDYAERIPDADLGDLIAYLLTPDAD